MSDDLTLYLRYKVEQGMEARGLADKREYQERVEYELRIIEGLGLQSYFLVVADLLEWAREAQIPTGPGRGSGVGSLVCYCLRITHLDPIKYGLYFERFLNPGRAGRPVVDTKELSMKKFESDILGTVDIDLLTEE